MLSKIKKRVWQYILGTRRYESVARRYCAERVLWPGVFCTMSGRELRRLLYLPESEYFAQLNQDIFALLMNRFRPGYFLEIGANDGFSLSNTLYLEEQFGWNGALVEANPRYMDSLVRRKRSVVVNRAISDQPGEAEFVDGGLYGGLHGRLDDRHVERIRDAARIKVQCITLEQMLHTINPPPVIDFLSIDVEGVDLQILEGFVRTGYRVRCGCVEMNRRESDIRKAGQILQSGRYEIAWAGQTSQDLFFVDPELVRGRV